MSSIATEQFKIKATRNRRFGLALALMILLYIGAVIAFIVVY
jgi:hypothetical protein